MQINAATPDQHSATKYTTSKSEKKCALNRLYFHLVVFSKQAAAHKKSTTNIYKRKSDITTQPPTTPLCNLHMLVLLYIKECLLLRSLYNWNCYFLIILLWRKVLFYSLHCSRHVPAAVSSITHRARIIKCELNMWIYESIYFILVVVLLINKLTYINLHWMEGRRWCSVPPRRSAFIKRSPINVI